MLHHVSSFPASASSDVITLRNKYTQLHIQQASLGYFINETREHNTLQRRSRFEHYPLIQHYMVPYNPLHPPKHYFGFVRNLYQENHLRA